MFNLFYIHPNEKKLEFIINLLNKIQMTFQEVTDQLTAVNTRLAAIDTAVIALVAAVKGAGNVPQSVVDAVNAVAATTTQIETDEQ